MKALFSEQENGFEIKIVGSCFEWNELSNSVKTSGLIVNLELVLDSKPYQKSCINLIVEDNTKEKVKFSISGRSLIVHGSPINLSKLADSLKSFSHDFQNGEHFHLDSIDSDFVSDDSGYVVLEIEESTG